MGTGFIRRIFGLIKGSVEITADKLAEENVASVYANSISEEKDEYNDLRQLLKEAKGEEFKINEEISSLNKRIEKIDEKIQFAIETNDEENGAKALQEKDEVENKIKTAKDKVEQIKSTVDDILESIEKQGKVIKDLEQEAIDTKSAIKTNNVMEKIRNKHNSIGGSDDKNLDAVRKAANEAKAGIMANKELSKIENGEDEFTKKMETASAKNRFKELMQSKKEN